MCRYADVQYSEPKGIFSYSKIIRFCLSNFFGNKIKCIYKSK